MAALSSENHVTVLLDTMVHLSRVVILAYHQPSTTHPQLLVGEVQRSSWPYTERSEYY